MRSKWKRITLNSKFLARHKGVYYLQGRGNKYGQNPRDIIILADYKPFVTRGVESEIAFGKYFAFAYRSVPISHPEDSEVSVVISKKPSVEIFVDKDHEYKIFIPDKKYKADYYPEHNNGEFARIFIGDRSYILTDIRGSVIVTGHKGEFECSLDPSCASATILDTTGMDMLATSMRLLSCSDR